MTLAYIGLGSNLCDPKLQVQHGLSLLRQLPRTRLLRASQLYLSPAWGMVNQPDFVNAVAELETSLLPRALLHELLQLENKAGRTRETVRWGPRKLDLDLLLWSDCIVDEPGLKLPHKHMHERAFVLLPLAELLPQLEIPGYGPVSKLLEKLDISDCRPLEQLERVAEIAK